MQGMKNFLPGCKLDCILPKKSLYRRLFNLREAVLPTLYGRWQRSIGKKNMSFFISFENEMKETFCDMNEYRSQTESTKSKLLRDHMHNVF